MPSGGPGVRPPFASGGGFQIGRSLATASMPPADDEQQLADFDEAAEAADWSTDAASWEAAADGGWQAAADSGWHSSWTEDAEAGGGAALVHAVPAGGQNKVQQGTARAGKQEVQQNTARAGEREGEQPKTDALEPLGSPVPDEELNDDDWGMQPAFVHEGKQCFDGSSPPIELPHSELCNPCGSFSVEIWVRLRSGSEATRGSLRYMLLTKDSGKRCRGYAFVLSKSGCWAFWVGMPERCKWLKVESPTCAAEDSWQRLTGIWRASGRTATLFVGDEKVACKLAVTNAKHGYLPNRDGSLCIGGGEDEESAPFVGDLCGPRIYGYALEAPLIADVPDETLDYWDTEPLAKRVRTR